MVCKKCSTTINSEDTFCRKCGNKTEVDTPTLPEETAEEVAEKEETSAKDVLSFLKKKEHRTVLAVSLVALLAAVIAIVFIINPFNNDPAIAVIAALEEGNYDEALVLAWENMDSETLPEMLEQRLDTLISEFKAENIEFSVVSMELDAIGNIHMYGLWGLVNTTRNTINNLNFSRTAFNTAEMLFHSGEYASAIGQYRLVIQDDPNFENALIGMRNATDGYRSKILDEANEHINKGEYESAVLVLEHGLRIIENDSELTQTLTLTKQKAIDAYRSEILAEAYENANRTNYEGSIQIIERGLRSIENDSELLQALASYQTRFVESMISNARRSVGNGDYNAAITTLNYALRYVPDNEQLIRVRDEVNAMRPVNLLELEPVTSQHWNPNETKTQIPLLYENVWSSWRRSEAYFFVDGGFSTLRGTITADEHLRTETRMQIRVFADDVLVYESHDIQRASTFDFEVNITGARFIRIRVANRNYRFPDSHLAWNGRVMASNLTLIR